MMPGETATRGLTNGVYVSCTSFRTLQSPVATVALLHNSLPTRVIAHMFTWQQPEWLHRHEMEVACKLNPGEDWPRGVGFCDRVEHPDGSRYYVVAPGAYVWLNKGIGDLPVFKECLHRIHGPTALLGSSFTFEPRQGPLVTSPPSNDARRRVSDAAVTRWSRMLDALRTRAGADKIGQKFMMTAKTVAGITPAAPDFGNYPRTWVWDIPEGLHCMALNNATSVLFLLKVTAKTFDPQLVRILPYPVDPTSFCTKSR